MSLCTSMQDDDLFQDSFADSLMCNYDSSMDVLLTGGNSIDEGQKCSDKDANDDGRVEGNVTSDSDLNVFSQKPKTEDSLKTNKLSLKNADKLKKLVMGC